MPSLTVRSVDLNDRDLLARQKAGEAGAEAPGSFNPHRRNRAHLAQPTEQGAIALHGCGELFCAEKSANIIEGHRNMKVLVSVDSTGDRARQICHCGPVVLS